jgi:outer membrane protein insertion porin family
MMSVALLSCALAAGSAGAAPAASGAASPAASSNETVLAVEVEARQAERLRAFVALTPGQPLDREAVRRAVELMFATGRFEDVPVELVRDEQGRGVTVVFRPLPAPLLAAVRVAGDRVLSAGALARIARLRPGEPLWPSRLERAARDVGLALARRGMPEALVDADAARVADGADAVFRIHAGPRVRVGRVAVEADSPVDTAALRQLARPRAGAVYRKEQADAAAEAMRRQLVRAGHWRATVELRPTYDPGLGIMDLVFHVQPGPQMKVEVRGTPGRGERAASIGDLLRDGGVSADTLAAASEQLETRLRALGYREVVVRMVSEPHESSETLVFQVEPGPRAIAASVELRGADAALLSGLHTRAGRPIVDAALDEDARTLVARLEARGHFEAAVETELPEGGGNLAVVFVARPGPRAVVRSVAVEGPAPPTEHADERPPELAVRAGLPYRLAEVARSRDALVSAWRRAGYLDVRVRPEISLSPAQDEASIRFVIEPGARNIVEHLVLAGLQRTKPEVVEREMVLRPGEAFSFERVLESQRRLSSLGIFERVSISELEPGREPRAVVVSVQEAPRTTVAWGLGYSEQDRVRGSVELTRRNLGGLGRSGSIFARASFRGSRLLANYREPWLFGKRLDSFLTGFWEEEARTSFDYSRGGGTLLVGRSVDPRTSVILRYLLQDTHVYDQRVPIDEIDRQYRTYTVSGPSASLVFDSRDDPLEPKRGVLLSADAQLSLRRLGGESFLRGYFQAASVHRLRSDLVLVVSGRLGLAESLAAETPYLPLPERFFAGGDYGPRGFAEDTVGPWLPGSNGGRYPTGGNALVLGGTELRYNLTRAFQLASFLDVGNVYTEVHDIALGELRRSVGIGVRYRTPIGPVRLDWGYVLDHKASDGDSRYRFHFTVGHAF